jgi:Fe-S-cluster-containing hydrogenase component 2
VITHNADKCIVCKMCVSACPLGNISYSVAKKKVFKCDLCDGETWCAVHCPTGAISVIDPDEALDKKKLAADKLKAAVEEVSA